MVGTDPDGIATARAVERFNHTAAEIGDAYRIHFNIRIHDPEVNISAGRIRINAYVPVDPGLLNCCRFVDKDHRNSRIAQRGIAYQAYFIINGVELIIKTGSGEYKLLNCRAPYLPSRFRVVS